jgi:predicted  nucleic acid-binding Zn-ribbon protein
VAASLPELEMRVRALEAKTTRLDEDTEAYGDTITDTNQRVRRLERAIEAIAAALNVEIPAEPDPELDD